MNSLPDGIQLIANAVIIKGIIGIVVSVIAIIVFSVIVVKILKKFKG